MLRMFIWKRWVMSTTPDYIEFVLDQIDNKWNKRSKKMFGEYMIYVNEKPILLVCNNTVYVKELDCIKTLFPKENKGFPYKGAKEHYIVDVEDKELFNNIIDELVRVVPLPVKNPGKSG